MAYITSGKESAILTKGERKSIMFEEGATGKHLRRQININLNKMSWDAWIERFVQCSMNIVYNKLFLFIAAAKKKTIFFRKWQTQYVLLLQIPIHLPHIHTNDINISYNKIEAFIICVLLSTIINVINRMQNMKIRR